MKKFTKNFSLATGLMACLMVSGSAFAEHTRASNPTALSLEFLGRGLLYSVNFDRVVADDLVAGVGYGQVQLNNLGGGSANKSVNLLPIYINYYFAREAQSLYVTAGVSLVLNPGDTSNTSSSMGGVNFSSVLVPSFGLGYESRSDSGFLFRMCAYGLVDTTLHPWIGASFGYSF